MAELAAVAAVASTVLTAGSQYAQGRQAESAARSEGQQMRFAAGQEVAASQRAAEEERRQARLVQSAVQARAGGDSGPGVADIYSDIAGEGEYRALSAIYEGDSRATTLKNRARMRDWEGKSAKRAGTIAAVSTIIGGASSMSGKYGTEYSYNDDASGYRYSRTGSDIMGRR